MSYVNSIFMIYYIFKLSTFLGGKNSLFLMIPVIDLKNIWLERSKLINVGNCGGFLKFFHRNFWFWNWKSFGNFIFNLILILLAFQTPTVLKRSTSLKQKASNCPSSPKVLHISQFSIKHVTKKLKSFHLHTKNDFSYLFPSNHILHLSNEVFHLCSSWLGGEEKFFLCILN